MNDRNRVKVAKMLENMKIKDSSLDQALQKIKYCLEHPHLFNVYEADSGVDIDGAILNALMEGNILTL